MITPNGFLTPGRVSQEQLDLILSFSSIRGENILAALSLYFVKAQSQAHIQVSLEINQSLLSRKIGDVEKLSRHLYQDCAQLAASYERRARLLRQYYSDNDPRDMTT